MDVRLGPIEMDHLWQLRSWRNSDAVRLRAREYRLLNMVNQKDWFESMSRDRTNEMFIITVPHETAPKKWLDKNELRTQIGVCGLCNIDWVNRHAEVSIYIGKKGYQRKGIATKVLGELLEQKAFDEFGLHKLWAEIYEFNEPSKELFEKCGYSWVGTLHCHIYANGRYFNSLLYEKFAPSRLVSR